MAKKYTKSEIEGMIKNLKEKEKKARSKWGKAVLQDAQWLLENVIEGYDEPYELSEKLVLNGAENWKEFSYGASALVYDGDIAEHYCTPSELKKVGFKKIDLGNYVEKQPNANEEWLDVQARALRQAWWAIRDEMNGTTEFSMSLCEFSEEGREKNNFEINDEQYDYKEAVKNDVLDYIHENYEKGDITEENRDEIEQSLYDDLFVSDRVTGNASGSYTFNTWKAESYLCHNLDLLMEAMQEFGSEPSDFTGAEWGDVTIRCYLLSGAISEAIDEFLNENDDDSNMSIHELSAQHDARKSFYGKAQVDVDEKTGVQTLYSYGTKVAQYNPKTKKFTAYPEAKYSATTKRHVREFMKQNGVPASEFSILDDTKEVLRATGKLAGNIVKNTTDKGGLLMF